MRDASEYNPVINLSNTIVFYVADNHGNLQYVVILLLTSIEIYLDELDVVVMAVYNNIFRKVTAKIITHLRISEKVY